MTASISLCQILCHRLMRAIRAQLEKTGINDFLYVDLLLACIKQVVIKDWRDQSVTYGICVHLQAMVTKDCKKGLPYTGGNCDVANQSCEQMVRRDA